MNKSQTDIVVGINNLYYFCILFLQIPKHCDYEKFLSFSILAAAALTMTPAVNAQEADYNYTNIPPVKDIYTHSWRDNWYIQLGAGAQMPIFEKTEMQATSK